MASALVFARRCQHPSFEHQVGLPDEHLLVYPALPGPRDGAVRRPDEEVVADLAPPGLRGRSFGLRQALDAVGAFAGPLAAIALEDASATIAMTTGSRRLPVVPRRLTPDAAPGCWRRKRLRDRGGASTSPSCAPLASARTIGRTPRCARHGSWRSAISCGGLPPRSRRGVDGTAAARRLLTGTSRPFPIIEEPIE